MEQVRNREIREIDNDENEAGKNLKKSEKEIRNQLKIHMSLNDQ